MLSRKMGWFLKGQFAQAGIERPVMYAWDRVHLARRTLANTNFEFGDDPRTLAARLGITVVPGVARECGGELVEHDAIIVSATATRRERGLRTFHGIAHHLLRREGWEHTHGDVWLLTGNLVVPFFGNALFDAADVIARAHAPASFTERWLAFHQRLDRRARADEEAA